MALVDNPWAPQGASNQDWEQSILGFVFEESKELEVPVRKPTQAQHKPRKPRILSPEFSTALLNRFNNLSADERARFAERTQGQPEMKRQKRAVGNQPTRRCSVK